MNSKNLSKNNEDKLSESSINLSKNFRFDQHNSAKLMQFITSNYDGKLVEFLKLVLLMATTTDSSE